ncbi:MAG: helix-turn-helix transcriptional regulator [Rhizobiaceae bacterium]
MLSHERVWAAIDKLAARKSMSASALAKSAGLDPTAFNKSKRVAADGRPRWPSTESLAKIMAATGSSLDELFGLLAGSAKTGHGARAIHIPLLGLAQAGNGGYFDDAGLPSGEGWDEVTFPGPDGENVMAIEVSGESMLPLYRDGDVLLVDRSAQCRKGDRVVVRTREGEVLAKILQRQSAKTVDLISLNPDHPNRSFAPQEVDWMGRIVWASQ